MNENHIVIDAYYNIVNNEIDGGVLYHVVATQQFLFNRLEDQRLR